MTELKIIKGSANVFEDLGFDVQESQNLLLRSQTMIALVQWFNASGMTQASAAKTLGITQPRFNQLLKGKIIAKDVHLFIDKLLHVFDAGKLPGETFADYTDRVKKDEILTALDWK